MSIGIGIGDIIKLTEYAWRLYKGYKDSSADFAQLTTELQSLYVVLAEISDFLQENENENDEGLDTSRRNRLEILSDGCCDVLREMEAVHTHYESLGTQQQRTWDRMKLGLKDLSELRGRLVSCTTLLTAWNVAVVNSSTSRINRKLDKFVAEVRAGLREGSVVTAPDVAQSIDSSPDVWNELRRELEDVGISAAAVEEKKEYILAWFRQQLVEGGLDEAAAAAAATLLPFGSPAGGAAAAVSPHSDSGYDGSGIFPSYRGSVSQDLSLVAANRAFEEELKRQRIEWRPDEGVGSPLKTRTPSSATAATVSVRVRRRTDPMVMIRKLFKKDNAIIQAASDGQIEQVAKLISLGMDVNARDQWGWSALSMCGYGGFKEIARLLLDHGADLDNVDIDGDTPTSLAAQRGHVELVLLFDEEREARDRRVRELDKEIPRRVET